MNKYDHLDVNVAPAVIPVVVALADEGIPLSVIARATKSDLGHIRTIVTDAVESGRVIEMPRFDWPPTSKRADRVPHQLHKSLDDNALMVTCMKVFKVTRLQATVLMVLLRKDEAYKSTLHNAIESRRHVRAGENRQLEPTNPKMVDVVICHLRKKLKRHGIEIKTLWSQGYFMDGEHRKKAFTLLETAVTPEPGHG